MKPIQIKDYYEVRGQGEPVVFIHGSYATTATWRKMVDYLSHHFKCVMFKLPGHCGLPDPDDFDCPTVETELTLLEKVIEEVSQDPVHLVGHSYGGVVALALALKESIPLRKLTLYEPVATWVLNRAGNQQLLNVVNQFRQEYKLAIDRHEPDAGGKVIDFWCNSAEFVKFPEDVRIYLATLVKNNLRHWEICSSQEYTLEDVARLCVPANLVAGTESVNVTHGIIDVLHQYLPKSEKHIIQGANHLLVTTHKDACLAAM